MEAREAEARRLKLRRDPQRVQQHLKLEEKLSEIQLEICRAYGSRDGNSAIHELAQAGQRVVEKLLALDCADAELMRDYLRDAYEEIEDAQGLPQPALDKAPTNLILLW